ncbi:MAG: polysaccharide deacetylase family protein, partial [Gemmatimonadota bacterium]|nr:polysaccharide deacetylase family protein [Gemmatimonadota bacterium]
MSDWLTPVRRALEGLPRAVPIFFRDDDAGWDDARLFQLLDRFAAHRMPIDLAVIPDALTLALAKSLLARRTEAGGRLGMHQHGWTHRNHQPAGRSCEFGPARTPAEIRHDLRAGRARLADHLGVAVDPIFTPPWNRCSEETGRAVRELEFVALSRDRTAPPFALPGLLELPIAVDWFAKRSGLRLEPTAFGALLAQALSSSGPIGIMLHHAVTTPSDFQRIEQLL